MRPGGWARRRLIYLLIPLVVALGYANYRFALQAPGGRAFLPTWTAVRGWILEGRDLYNLEVSLESQRAAYGRPADPARGEDPLHYTSGLVTAALAAPFALLPYPLARAAWMTMLELALPALALLGMQLSGWHPRPPVQMGLLLLPILWFPGVDLLVAGDAVVIEGLVVLGVLVALQRRSDVPAGMLLALSTSYPGAVSLILPMLLVWAISTRRWRFVASFGLTTAAVVGLTIVVFDGWPLEWLRRVVDTWQTTQPSSAVFALGGLAGRASTLTTAAVAAVLLGVAARQSQRTLSRNGHALAWLVPFAMTTTLIGLPQRDAAGLTLLIPGIALIVHRMSERTGGATALIAGVWVLAAATWIPFLVSPDRGAGGDTLVLALPALVWGGLWWIRWWAVRPPLPTLEAG